MLLLKPIAIRVTGSAQGRNDSAVVVYQHDTLRAAPAPHGFYVSDSGASASAVVFIDVSDSGASASAVVDCQRKRQRSISVSGGGLST